MLSLSLSLSYKMESRTSGATTDISQASPHLETLRNSDIVWGVVKGCSLIRKDISYRISFPTNLDSSVKCGLLWLQKNSSFCFLTLIATPGHKGQNP